MKARLSDAVTDYLQFSVSRGDKPLTLRNTKSVLLTFLAEVGNIWCDSVADRHVTEFLALKSKTCGPNSLGQLVIKLNGFFEWCRRTKRIPPRNDPMAGRRQPTRIVRERARVHVSQFPALLDAAGRRSPRDRMFVALALYTLARTSEITTLKVGDVDLAAGYLHIKVWKSNLEDRLGIPTELDTELRRWLTEYSVHCGSLDGTWNLVPARKLLVAPGVCGQIAPVRYEPLRRPTHTETIVKPALEAIGFAVPGQVDLRGEGSHTLRRSAARALFDRLVEQGYDHALSVVKAQMHHKSQSMTEAYIGVTADRFKRDAILRGQPMFGLPEVTSIDSRRGDSEGYRASV